MQTKFIEAVNRKAHDGRNFNWGKFMIARFTAEEWNRRSEEGFPGSLIDQLGWARKHLMIFDLQTGEGAFFKPGGWAKADLDKHKIWVCPMFEPFLEWLYKQNLDDLNALPNVVDLNDSGALSGYRRSDIKDEPKS